MPIMLHLHPQHQLTHGPLIRRIRPIPPRRVPDPQLGRPGVLLRMPLERENGIVMAQKRLTSSDQLMEPFGWAPHLPAMVLLKADEG